MHCRLCELGRGAGFGLGKKLGSGDGIKVGDSEGTKVGDSCALTPLSGGHCINTTTTTRRILRRHISIAEMRGDIGIDAWLLKNKKKKMK